MNSSSSETVRREGTNSLPAPEAGAKLEREALAEQWFGLLHKALGDLQAAHRTSGVTAEVIAARIGSTPATVDRRLRGRGNMTLRTMHELARGMGCRLRVVVEKLPPPPFPAKLSADDGAHDAPHLATEDEQLQ